MKFVNVKLTKEEREAFKARKIKNPYGSIEDICDGVNPMYLTIDKETDTWLTWCYFDHEAYEFVHEFVHEYVHEFLFMYKQCPMPVQTIWEYNKDNGLHWRITRLNIPDNLLSEKEIIKDLVVSAFLVYNVTGWPEDCTSESKTTCSFSTVCD